MLYIVLKYIYRYNRQRFRKLRPILPIVFISNYYNIILSPKIYDNTYDEGEKGKRKKDEGKENWEKEIMRN